MNNRRYKHDEDGALYLDKQYWDRKECLHFTDKESIEKHALPTVHVEMRSMMHSMWKYDNMYNCNHTYDMNKIVFRVRVHEENDAIVDNYIEPCIIYGDDRKAFDQYFVDRISPRLLERVKKKNKPGWKHLELSIDSKDSLTIIERHSTSEKYAIHKPIYETDKSWTWTKIFGNYEMANSYRYNKVIELKNHQESIEYEEECQKAVELIEDRKVITLSDIARKFNCDKNKIILDLSK